jgi:hypothetical protein
VGATANPLGATANPPKSDDKYAQKSVQLVRGSSFHIDFLQNPYFRVNLKTIVSLIIELIIMYSISNNLEKIRAVEFISLNLCKHMYVFHLGLT